MTLTNNEAMEQLMTALRNDDSVPLWKKSNLTLDEAAVYSGIGKKQNQAAER